MRIAFYAFLLLFCFSVLVGKGQVTSHAVLLQDTTYFVPIGRSVFILEDKTARLTLAQVRQRPDFRPSYSEKFQYGFTSSAYWFRFEVTNHSQENQKHWLLGLLVPGLSERADSTPAKRAETALPGSGFFCHSPVFSGYFPC
jgi:hypothetical protein